MQQHALVMGMVLPLVGGGPDPEPFCNDAFMRSLLHAPLKKPFDELVRILSPFASTKEFLRWEKREEDEDFRALGQALRELTEMCGVETAPACVRKSGWSSFFSAACLQRDELPPALFEPEILEVHARLMKVLRVVRFTNKTRAGTISRGINYDVMAVFREAESFCS